MMKPLSREEFEMLAASSAAVLGTGRRPVIIPGEAIWGIEAFARNVAAPGRVFLNIDTGPYGKLFGEWLREGGASVEDLSTKYNEVVSIETVEEAVQRVRPCAISFVQTEAITGGANPAREILALARRENLITIMDSVSAVGADEVYMDRWGIDFIAEGMQKALGGPNGISFMGVSERGMEFVRSNPRAIRRSILSLLDLYEQEQEEVPENIPVLEARAAIEAFQRIEEETLEGVCRRHARTALAARAGIKALGLTLWQRDERGCTNLNTTVQRPEDFSVEALLGQRLVTEGNGSLAASLLRINHYGENAGIGAVRDAIGVLAKGSGIASDTERVEKAFLAAETAWKGKMEK